jgi:hypothetical protein
MQPCEEVSVHTVLVVEKDGGKDLSLQKRGSNSNGEDMNEGACIYLILRLNICPPLQKKRYDFSMTSIGSIVEWCPPTLRKRDESSFSMGLL